MLVPEGCAGYVLTGVCILQVQDMSNKAAARYDKANSQHTAAKEMIRVAESQLDACREEQDAYEEPSSPSPLDLAWQEMLNHATAKVQQSGTLVAAPTSCC